MQFRRQSVQEVNVNLTPLIDVVFLLLIFFMVSTTFTKETHLSLDLPEANGEATESVPSTLEILISADGRYSVNGRGLVNNDIDTLMAALEEQSQGDRRVALVLTADAATPHQAVIRAMDAAGQLGFVHLSLTTRKPSE